MEHRLHVLVRLDIDRTSARVEVSGGLSYDGFAASQNWNAEQTQAQQRRQGSPVVVVAPKRLPPVTGNTGTTHTAGRQAPGSADRKLAAA